MSWNLGSPLPRPLSGLRLHAAVRIRGFVPQPHRPVAGTDLALSLRSSDLRGAYVINTIYFTLSPAAKVRTFFEKNKFFGKKISYACVAYVINIFIFSTFGHGGRMLSICFFLHFSGYKVKLS